MDFQSMRDKALDIRRQYEEKEIRLYGAPWTIEEVALGFVGDVGDLAKLVIAEAGKRKIPDSREKLAHELADCLWSIIVLAEKHHIDLEKSFMETMQDIEEQINSHS